MCLLLVVWRLRSLFVLCCLMVVVCCLLFAVRCVLIVVDLWCMLSDVIVVRCVGVCCVLCFFLFVVDRCRLLFAVCC